MPRGPLPNPERRRTNAPTIPTTSLPAGGYKGPIPKPPKGVPLGERGRAWWRWAWRTPQAAAWSTGDLYTIARRARLEDDIEILEYTGLDLDELPITDPEFMKLYLEGVDVVLRTLKRLASGGLALAKEQRELDDRLGLTPKGWAALRWKHVAGEATEATTEEDDADNDVARKRKERKTRLAAGG